MINREIGIMARLQHPTLVQFFGYSLQDFNGENNVTIIMKLYQIGTLAALLENSKKGLAPESYDNTTRQKILIGIARGMMFLHQNHAIHRDLKPDNILLDENYQPHITDFGLSKIYDNDFSISQTQTIGTCIYMAPEMINGDYYNGKIDVYSFGIIMYEIITDLTPYPLFQSGKMKVFQLQNKIINEKYRPKFDVPVKKSLKDLIVQCWSEDPKERPTFEEIYKKLSFNMEESVYDVFENNTEYKFYLDDVVSDEVLSYVYDINDNEQTKSSSSSNSCIKEIKNSIENLQNQLNEYIQKVTDLTIENNKITSRSIEQENIIKTLLNENQQMKMNISKQDKIINDLSNEISEIKKQSINSPSSIKSSSIEPFPIEKKSVDLKSTFVSKPTVHQPIKKSIEKFSIKPPKREQSYAKFGSKTSSSPIQTIPGVFTFISHNPETDGIFSYLTKEEGKNLHYSGMIEVTTNSLFSNDFHPKNLLNFGKDIYKANRSNSIMIIFDFKQMKIDITGYSIKTAKSLPKQGQPKSWMLEISNDGINWEIIDEINNCKKLINPDTIQFFSVKRKYFARYCRFNHNDDCWMDKSYYPLKFKGIDFFGNVKVSDE